MWPTSRRSVVGIVTTLQAGRFESR